MHMRHHLITFNRQRIYTNLWMENRLFYDTRLIFILKTHIEITRGVPVEKDQHGFVDRESLSNNIDK